MTKLIVFVAIMRPGEKNRIGLFYKFQVVKFKFTLSKPSSALEIQFITQNEIL